MNNIERIFEAVCNILSVYVSFKVTDVFLEKKRKLPRMANIVYVIVWLINTVVAFGFRNAMGTTVSMVLLLWAAMFHQSYKCVCSLQKLFHHSFEYEPRTAMRILELMCNQYNRMDP